MCAGDQRITLEQSEVLEALGTTLVQGGAPVAGLECLGFAAWKCTVDHPARALLVLHVHR